MDDVYDVRAAETQLARMEAARRARSREANKTVAVPAVVSDFELRAVDSDSDDDGNGDAMKPHARLRDSLDLSMSVSMAMPAEAVASRKAIGAKPRSRGLDGADARGGPQVTTRPAACGNNEVDKGDALFAGKLVQRRRELERRAQEQQTPSTEPQATQLAPAPSSSLIAPVTTKGELNAPGAVVSRVPTHAGNPSSEHDEESRRPAVRLILEPRLIVKMNEQSRGPLKGIPETQSIGTLQQPQHVIAPRGVVAPTVAAAGASTRNSETAGVPKRVVDLPSASAATTVATSSTVPVQLMKQRPSLAPPARQASESATVVPKNPQADLPIAKKSVASTTSSPPAAQFSTTTVPTATSKPPGYARANPSSSQQQVPPVPIVKKAPSPTKCEPDDHSGDDIIDDLLTAEELRLRESLDKLSQRLTSLNSSARAPTTTRSDAPPSNQSPTPDLRDEDDSKTIRSASYGGSAHTRLHQPTSQTSRASHARRSELSGGVHKARVRTGGGTAQEATANRTDTAADGKHKITVKRDLAHLLF